MNQPDDSTIPPTNRLLAALPRDEYDRLLSNLELVRLPRNRILCEAGDTMQCAYFLNSGMASCLATTEEGQLLEIATVGNEGFLGIPIIHEVGIAPYRVVVQMRAEALKVEADALLTESRRGSSLRQVLSRYAHVLEAQMVQSVVCHVLHNVSQRVCRYLLVTSDCIQSDELSLTQEEIADVLGKDRSQVGLAASVLREKGMIHYRRGSMTILDRGGLERSSCECYRIVKDAIDNTLKA